MLAYESAVFCSASSVTDKDQQKLFRKSILGSGDPDGLTLPEQMVLGINQFDHLYDDVLVAVNDDRNAQSAKQNGTYAGLTSFVAKRIRQQTQGLFFSRRRLPVACFFYLCEQA